MGLSQSKPANNTFANISMPSEITLSDVPVPNDVIKLILQYLAVSDWQALRLTCRDLRNFIDFCKYLTQQRIRIHASGYNNYIFGFEGLIAYWGDKQVNHNWLHVKKATQTTQIRGLSVNGITSEHGFDYVATKTDGSIYHWTNGPTLPTKLDFPYDEHIKSMTSTSDAIVVLTAEGNVYFRNISGEAQFEICKFSTTTKTIAITSVTDDYLGTNIVITLSSEGEIYQLTKTSHTAITLRKRVIAIAGGKQCLIALDESGEVFQYNVTVNVWSPIIWSSIIDVNITAISMSAYTSLALSTEGHVHTWTSTETVSSLIHGLKNIVQISSGRAHHLALDNKGQLWTWSSHSRHGENGLKHISQETQPLQLVQMDRQLRTQLRELVNQSNHN